MAARVTAFVVFAIVAVTFVAGLIVGAQRADDSGPVDLIVYNAKIYTGDPAGAFAEAIAVRGNRILRVGSNREIKRLMRRATTVIDAHGGSVTAGFHDGRVDLQAAGRALQAAAQANATGTSDTGPAAAARDTAAAPVLASVGAPSGSAPTAVHAPRATGAAAARMPAAARATSAGVASVLQASRVTALASPDLPVPQTPEEALDAIRRAVAAANRAGITSVEVTARNADDLQPYDTLLRAKELKARVSAALLADWPLDEAAAERLDATRKRYEPVPFFKVEAVRLVVNDDGGGVEREAALGRTIALLEERDWTIVLQTANAAGATLALNAVEAARGPDAAASADEKPRVRLELAAPVDDEMAARIARLGLIASVPQPDAIVADAAAAEADGAGEGGGPAAALAASSWPYLNLLVSAAPVVFHSGWPLSPMDPRFALSAVLLDGLLLLAEKTPDEETLSARLARVLDAYTRHGAYALGDEDEKGTIAKEMLADLVIFSTDLFTLPSDKILDAEVATTIFDGAVVYTKPDLAPITDSESQ